MEMLGLKDVIAALPEVREGVYTGRLIAPHPLGIRKANLAEAWLQDHGYRWSQTVAIANHWDDRFLLERARASAVVHPCNRLRRLAIGQGWAVVDDARSPLISIVIRELLSRWNT